MKLKPACSWCKDHSEFEENLLLKILVTSFIKLCEYIYSTPIGKRISAETVNGETNSLISILQEALSFEDDYVVLTSQTEENQNDFKMKETVKVEPVHPVPGCSNSEDIDDIQIEAAETSKTLTKNQEKHTNHFIPNISTDTDNNKINRSQKTVVFMKRAAKNRLNKKSNVKPPVKKSLLKIVRSKKSRLHVSKMAKREPVSDFYPKVTLSAESDLENEQAKRMKLDLPPPELKPPSFCRCGKSGRYNQLTCLGQRCPCYSMKLPCIGCKCKGCRNPKKGPPTSGQDHYSSAVLRSGVRNHNDSL